MLLDFIWHKRIIDSIVVKDRWQTITLSGILDTIWLLPSSPTSWVLNIKYLFNKMNSNLSIFKELLSRISAFFLTNWVITPSFPCVAKMLLSVMKLVCQRPLRGLFVCRYVFDDMIFFYLMWMDFLVDFILNVWFDLVSLL